MRITAISAGVVSCAFIFALGGEKASATTPINLAVADSPSLIEDLAMQNAAADEQGPDNSDTAQNDKKKEKPQPIEHTVEDGESLSKIAEKYKSEHKTTWIRLYDKNTAIADPDVIAVGDTVVIPRADEELEKRELPAAVAVASPTVAQTPAVVTETQQPQTAAVANCDEATQWVRADNGQCLDKPAARQARVTAPRATTAPAARPASATATAVPAPRGSTSGNLYSYGYCTWYVKNRRPDLPNNLGNADTWLSRARAQGYATGSTPRAGAVAYALTGYMHVAVVDRVNGDGTVTVSEMNFRGWNVTSTRTVPASQFAYIY